MWKKHKSKYYLFIAALLQVGCVSLNVYQVSHRYFIGAFIVGFLISILWSFNVKRISFGTTWDRVIYALGAATGTVLGILISHLLYS